MSEGAPACNLSSLVRTLGRGPGRARHLTRDEAAAAMSRMLSDDAAPEAVGALLMLMRYRGETADEIAGFVDALRAETCAWANIGARIDWPSYAAGRSRGAPWFLLAAKMLGQSGRPTLLHGWNTANAEQDRVRAAIDMLDIPRVETPAMARQALERHGIAYAPLERLAPEAYRLLRLRDVLGLRSPINTALRAFNPSAAPLSLQGVFHPSYRELQQETAALLGQDRLLVIKGGGGEFERHPGKPVDVMGLDAGKASNVVVPARRQAHVRLSDAPDIDLAALWQGRLDNGYAVDAVCGTAAAALFGEGAAPDLQAADALADDLWRQRLGARAA